MSALFIIIAFLFPALALFLTYRYAFFDKIGVVLLCYFGGIVLGNAGIFPSSIVSLQNTVSEVTVAVSLPLLLFSLNVKSWFRIAGKAILSMVLATTAVIAVSTVGYFIVSHRGYSGAYELAGMAVGVYTGGTPNLAAIKAALNISSSTYLRFHTYDALISLLYLIFILSVGKKFFSRFLIPFQRVQQRMADIQGESEEGHQSGNEYSGMLSPGILFPLGAALLLAAGVIGASLLISGYFPENRSAAITILSITTISIALSFIPRIRNIRKTFPGGMYIIYVFCFVVASMTDVRTLIHINYTILFFVIFSIFGSLTLHALLSKLFRIDTDTFMVTSVSAICSPPFVPVVAGALKNQAVLLSGLTTGIIGYALGNYLGISLALMLQSLS